MVGAEHFVAVASEEASLGIFVVAGPAREWDGEPTCLGGGLQYMSDCLCSSGVGGGGIHFVEAGLQLGPDIWVLEE